ncbi:hypothetical protein EVAR_70387_1 [Eumeta japonica]|uniref:Uncharacterized protein n=1 Tax=Eumeta variegata TaxID=151549 RepID=A0A4C2A2H5_EUMVA|nr:hypothetical protein EVAR_70387_1 [Eumeta japonica]
MTKAAAKGALLFGENILCTTFCSVGVRGVTDCEISRGPKQDWTVRRTCAGPSWNTPARLKRRAASVHVVKGQGALVSEGSDCPLLRHSTSPSNRYPIPVQEADSSLVTPARSQVFMGDHLYTFVGLSLLL